MNILTSIFTDDLAIDLGTVNTLIFAPERGVVLDEPSAVAIHKYTGEVLDVGAEAFKMLGRDETDHIRYAREGLRIAMRHPHPSAREHIVTNQPAILRNDDI